jgi:hypothetical protein
MKNKIVALTILLANSRISTANIPDPGMKDRINEGVSMKNLFPVLLLGFSLLTAALLLPGTGLASDKGESRESIASSKPTKTQPNTSRSFAFDNDAFVPGSRDQDYTYGLNLTFVGKGAKDQWASLHVPLNWLDQRIGLNHRVSISIVSSKIEYGLFGFTSEDIALAEPEQGDRPYASLIYVSSTSERYDAARQISWQSTLTLGFMGLNLVGDIQDWVHSKIGAQQPQGWDSQISDGGEPTARYSVARQRLMYKSDSGLEIKTTTQGSVGYITEANWSLSLRVGGIHTPWVSFNPELTSYGEKSIHSQVGKVSEHYFWTGVSLKARAYNSFLQGQLRDSAVTYDSDELNHGIVEAWVGYTIALKEGYSFSYLVRGHTSELKQGVGDRRVIWGGLQITKNMI